MVGSCLWPWNDGTAGICVLGAKHNRAGCASVQWSCTTSALAPANRDRPPKLSAELQPHHGKRSCGDSSVSTDVAQMTRPYMPSRNPPANACSTESGTKYVRTTLSSLRTPTNSNRRCQGCVRLDTVGALRCTEPLPPYFRHDIFDCLEGVCLQTRAAATEIEVLEPRLKSILISDTKPAVRP